MKRSFSRLVATSLITTGLLCVVSPAVAETGDLKITFKYADEAPTPEKVKPNADAAYCGPFNLDEENLLVNKENNGVKNVICYVYVGRRDPVPAFEPVEPKEVVLANQDCRFEPHVVLAMKGDTLKVDNPDEIGHNANLQFFNNKAQNPNIPAGQSVSVELTENEPAPIPVACNIHPWMKAYVVVLDHPFAGVSNDDGEVMITGLPAGEKLTFRINHETISLKKVEINGKPEKLRGGRFEVDIKPGMNDFGTITIGG